MPSPISPAHVLLAAVLVIPIASQAAIFTVGVDAACTHSSIQDAIDAAAADPDYDSILIARNQTYAAEALLIPHTALALSGGPADCTVLDPGTQRTLISGVGNGGLPVVRVDAAGGVARALVSLQNLELVGSGQSVAEGGVLQVRGWVQFSAAGVVLRDGQATRGGGLYAEGLDAANTAHLQFGGSAGVPGRIEDSQAQDGGGIYCGTHSFVSIGPHARVSGNAAQLGGGAFAAGACQFQLQAGDDSGALQAGLIDNEAVLDGGGLYAAPGASPSSARYFAELPPPLIAANRAGRDGGGAFLQGPGTFLLGYNLQLRGNTAGVLQLGRGGGLALRGGASAYLGEENESVRCGLSAACVEIAANQAGDAGTPGEGGGIFTEGGNVSLAYARLTGNQAGQGAAAFVTGNGGGLLLRNAIVDANAAPSASLRIQDGAQLNLTGSTLAADASGGSMLSLSSASANLDSSIVYDPGATVVASTGPSTLQTRCVLSHSDFHAAGDVRVGDPDFTNAAGGDFRLGPGSDALDACDGAGFFADETDFAEMPRGVDLAEVPDLGGAFDLGAHERQPELPDAVFGDGFEDPP